MSDLPFPSWAEQSELFKLPYTDTETCSEASYVVSKHTRAILIIPEADWEPRE